MILSINIIEWHTYGISTFVIVHEPLDLHLLPRELEFLVVFFVKYCLTAFNGILCFIDDKKKNIFMMRKNTIKDKAFHNNNKRTMKRPLI